MTCNHHGYTIGSMIDPVLQHCKTLQIEMVGGLVKQQHVRISDPDPGNQRQALPAAAEFDNPSLPHRLWGIQQVQHHADLPGIAFPFGQGKCLADRLVQRQVEQVGRDILFHEADAKSTTTGNLPVPGSIWPARQRSRVVLPAPLPAISPIRSVAWMAISRFWNSTRGENTPRRRTWIRLMVSLWVSVVAEATGRHAIMADGAITERAMPGKDEKTTSDPAFDPPCNIKLRGLPGSARMMLIIRGHASLQDLDVENLALLQQNGHDLQVISAKTEVTETEAPKNTARNLRGV